RELLPRPVVLVPAAAEQPAFRMLAPERLQPLECLLEAGRTGQPGLHLLEAKPGNMAMGVDQARHYRGRAEVDAAGIRKPLAQRVRLAQGHDPARLVGDRADLRLAILQGVD